MRWAIFVCLAACIIVVGTALARPMTERSPDGTMWRIVNPDPIAYYCWFTLGDGTEFENIIYANSATRWYSARGGFEWQCDT